VGQLKQMHIDCTDGDCQVPSMIESCYMQKDNVSYYEEDDTNLDSSDPNDTDTQQNIDMDSHH